MLGMNDPAGMMAAFANVINRQTEHTARVFSYRTMYAMDYDYDIEYQRIQDDDFSELEHLLKTSDIFHFHMLFDENHQIGPLMVRDYIEGKGLLYHHHGTYDHQIFEATAAQYNEKYETLGKRAIVSTPDLLKMLPCATWQPNLVPLNDFDLLPRADHLSQRDTFKVAQAPTRKWHKHTAEFIRATDRLMQKYDSVERHILEGLTWSECLKFKRSCHAVFDHMNGWFGIASLESLAQGIPTLAGLDDWTIKHIKDFTGVDDLPWVVVRNEEQLEESLEQLINNPSARVEIGKTSSDFMRRHWTEAKAIDVLLETYRNL